MGRYVLYSSKVCYVKSLRGDSLEIIDIISKREHKVTVQAVQLLETHGVNVFALDKEPKLV